ncbi:ubiquitin D [Erinaceus europaeus]|uniref:Ubiquitin D n=1 Tax=Erinaceus europaeus TaxID=9365 RepID=A0A1S3ABB9_ERIEU|nr:ubiquitin D [Erinaceus europaeus]
MASTLGVTVYSEEFQNLSFTATKNDRVKKINEHIRSRTNVPVKEQILKLGSKTLEEKRKLSSYGIDKETTIHLTLKVVKPDDEELLLTLVDTKDEGQRYQIEVRRSSSVTQVKEIIAAKTALPPDQQIVVCNGKKLEDGKTMKEYNIKKFNVLFLTSLCIGG